jgi:DNA-binding transcriptional MerR regulator
MSGNSNHPPLLFRIADVARLCGISASTLRFWEQHGLIKPGYTDSGHRVFSAGDLEQVRDIQRLRVVQGLSLAAIRGMRGRQGSENAHGAKRLAGEQLSAGDGVGSRLRTLRKKQGLSLREVAARTGLAHSFISTLERTSLGASAASIRKLATCYGTNVSELSSQLEGRCHGGENTVVRADEARVVPMLGPSIQIQQLARRDVMMDCQKWTLQPGAESEEAYAHEGEEFIHVLRGSLEVKLDGHERHLLLPGDSIYFASTRTHFWCNPGKEETEVLWVNTPPSF